MNHFVEELKYCIGNRDLFRCFVFQYKDVVKFCYALETIFILVLLFTFIITYQEPQTLTSYYNVE